MFMSVEIEKQSAGLMHLLAGPLGHLGVNALGRAAHHKSNLGSVLAHRGLQHGLTDSVVNPVAARTVKAFMGPEATVSYELSQRLGTHLAKLPPAKRQALLKQINRAPKLQGSPIIGPLQEAVGHELAGTAPVHKAKGVAANLYSGAVRGLTSIVNKPFDTGVQRAVKSVAGGAPLAVAAAADPLGTAAHVGVNTGRELLAKSRVGTRFIKKTTEAGLAGKKIPKVIEAATDYLASPGALDAYRTGQAIRSAVPAHIQQRMTPEAVRAMSARVPNTLQAGMGAMQRRMGSSIPVPVVPRQAFA